jgi:hypothetical protein
MFGRKPPPGAVEFTAQAVHRDENLDGARREHGQPGEGQAHPRDYPEHPATVPDNGTGE